MSGHGRNIMAEIPSRPWMACEWLRCVLEKYNLWLRVIMLMILFLIYGQLCKTLCAQTIIYNRPNYSWLCEQSLTKLSSWLCTKSKSHQPGQVTAELFSCRFSIDEWAQLICLSICVSTCRYTDMIYHKTHRPIGLPIKSFKSSLQIIENIRTTSE